MDSVTKDLEEYYKKEVELINKFESWYQQSLDTLKEIVEINGDIIEELQGCIEYYYDLFNTEPKNNDIIELLREVLKI